MSMSDASGSGASSGGCDAAQAACSGVPRTLASGQSEAYAVAVDDVNVYWTTFTGGTVMQAPIAGGAPITIASGQSNPTNIEVDAVNIYWAGSGLHAAPIGGGAVTQYVTDAFFLAIYGANIYFSTASGLIEMVPKAGGSPVTLLMPPGQQPSVIAADGNNVYFVMENGNSGASSTVLQEPATPSDGGATITIASAQGNTSSIATDGTNVYWANPANGTIDQAPVGGGAVTTLATTQGASSIAIDSAYVYWASGTAGTVSRTPKGGGPLKVIASNQAGVGGLAVSANYVAWATYSSVIVMTK
jgi:hypothetical protein